MIGSLSPRGRVLTFDPPTVEVPKGVLRKNLITTTLPPARHRLGTSTSAGSLFGALHDSPAAKAVLIGAGGLSLFGAATAHAAPVNAEATTTAAKGPRGPGRGDRDNEADQDQDRAKRRHCDQSSELAGRDAPDLRAATAQGSQRMVMTNAVRRAMTMSRHGHGPRRSIPQGGFWSASGSPTRPAPIRASFPAASSSASPSRAPSP
jgi:hypothetical protein